MAREAVLGRIPEIEALQGTFGQGPAALRRALDLIFDTQKEASRVRVYASTGASVALKDPGATERRALALKMLASLEDATSFVEPEILAVGERKIRGYQKREPGLAPYAFYLNNILRRAPHTLNAEGESVIAKSSLMTTSPSSIYTVLTTADFDWERIELNGETVVMDRAGYAKYREHPNREIRARAFESFWGTMKRYERSLGQILASEVTANLYQSTVRRHDGVLSWALSDSNVPASVYRTLVEQVNAALPTLHRYLELRARMLGIDGLRYHDMYPSLVEMEQSFDLDTSRTITIAALAPLGKEYGKKLAYGTAQRWQHAYPAEGKQGGAYMAGAAYDVHPYILLNHNDSFDSLSTYAHEWGHAVHTLLANEAQPFPTARYSTFLAEVASIGNELFLSAYMLENAQSDEERLFYLGQELELIRTTYFRQAMFAEFELAIHEEVESGGALSGDRLTAIYRNLLEKYHGHADGIVTIDGNVSLEWAYIPHFYYDFYVYQYATSIAGGALLVQQVLEKGDEARNQLLEVFRAGGSDYPYEILKGAGIDLATPAPYQALIRRMDGVIDQIESILDQSSASTDS